MVGVGVEDVFVAGAEEDVGVEEGVGVGVVRVDGCEGLAAGGYRGEEERERLLISVGIAFRVGVGRLADEVPDEGGGDWGAG